MKIKFIKPHPAFGYFPGQTGEVADDKAKELIEAKFAEESKEEEESEEDDNTENKKNKK